MNNKLASEKNREGHIPLKDFSGHMNQILERSFKMEEKDEGINELYHKRTEASNRQELGASPKDTRDADAAFEKAMFDKYGSNWMNYISLYRGF